jgi:hypothetical protein
MAKTDGFYKAVRASEVTPRKRQISKVVTITVADSGIIRSIIVPFEALPHTTALTGDHRKRERQFRAYKHADKFEANYPLRIIVFIKLITPPFTVSCCNDKQLGFDLHSIALAVVSIINFHSFFDVLCQTLYCITVTCCVQVS